MRRPHRLRVYPSPERLQRMIAPLETQAYAGNQVARVKGDGLEFADTRAYVPGDRLRSINWRASARRGELIVNDRHPERNTDVIVFLDSFAEARTARGEHARPRRAGGGDRRRDVARRPRPRRDWSPSAACSAG